MTTIDPTSEAVAHAGDTLPGDNSLIRFLMSCADWTTTADHKKIGRLFLGGGLLGLLGTIVLNLLWSLERADVFNAVDADAAAQLFDAQRVGLVFGSLLPLSVGLCIAVVPMQLGSRALAFPRLAASGFWMWLGGFVFAMIALINDGGSLGSNSDMVDLFIGAHALMALGLAAAGGSIAVSILTTRAPGMTMRRVPFFSISALITSLGLVLIMPVLFGTLTFLFLDHRNAREGFGGNIGIYDWVFWVFTQPTTFLFAIPAIGVLAELAPITFKKRTPARGIVFAGLALMGVAAFNGVAQQPIHSLPWAGSDLFLGGGDDVRSKLADLVPWAFFNLLPVLGATIVFLMVAFLAKPEKGLRPNVTPAFAFSFFGFTMVLVGMLGNALHAIDDLALQGTIFEEASLVYVVYGTVLGVMGGVAHWAPKLWGRSLPTAQALPLAGLGVLATVLASFPHYIAGFLDQVGGAAPVTDSDLQIWNILVLVGHALMALTVIAFVGLLAKTMTGDGDNAADDPFDGQTLEWTTTSPAPANNFVDAPTVMSAEPLLDLKPSNAAPSPAAPSAESDA